MFHEHWDELLKDLLVTLKEVEEKLVSQHQEELVQIVKKLEEQEPAKMKYSSEVLSLRKYLSSLVKIKDYKKAEQVKNRIEVLEKEQQQKWMEKHEIRQAKKLQVVKKKQENST